MGQVTNNSTGSAAAKITIYGFISSYMGRGCELEIHARMSLLHLSSCMYVSNLHEIRKRDENIYIFFWGLYTKGEGGKGLVQEI